MGPSPAQADPPDGGVLKSDPRPLHVEVLGEGDPPIVLLHGFGASAFSWRHWTPKLAERHRLYVVDLKGSGRAEKPADDRYRPLDHAVLVRRFLVEEDLRDATLMGHSLGGGLALLTTLLLGDEGEPERVGRLVLVSAAAYPQALPPIMGMLNVPGVGSALPAVVPPTLTVRAALRNIVHRSEAVTEEQVEGYAEPFRESAARYAAVRSARQIFDQDLEAWAARYGEVKVPALVLWGEHDPVIPVELGRKLAEALPRARLSVIPECGHLPAEEHPEASLEAVLDFLEETVGAPPPPREPSGDPP